jgi:hypothetical protein
VINSSVIALKRTLLAFWALWFTMVFATNLFDAAKTLGLLAESWPLASGNYRAIVEATARYEPPAWLNGLLFLAVLCWEAVVTALFWLAGWRYRSNGIGRQTLYTAFTCGLTLWAAFLIADEVCIAYAVTGAHLRLFVAQLVTLVAIEVLPEEEQPKACGQ